MNNKFFLYIMFLCILIFSVNAADPEQYYKINDNVNINIPCYTSDNEYCNSSTICNVTIINPKSDIIVDNKQMQYNIGFFNYTINPSNLGDFTIYSLCTDGVETGTDNFKIQINNIGAKIENLLPMLIFYIMILSVVLFLLIVTVNVESPMMLPLMFLLNLILTWIFFFIYMNTIGLNRIYYVFYWFFQIISVGIFFVILWFGTMWAIKNFSKSGKRQKDLGDNF